MKKSLITILILLFLTSLVIAANFPSTPSAFHGTIKDTDGNSIPDGYIITAKLNGMITGKSIVKDGEYGYADNMIVQAYGESGTITFYVNGKKAEQTAEFTPMAVTTLDLTVNSPPSNFNPTCGDNSCTLNECSSCLLDCNMAKTNTCIGNNICDSGMGETCSNTPQDCGQCPDPDPPNTNTNTNTNSNSNTNTNSNSNSNSNTNSNSNSNTGTLNLNNQTQQNQSQDQINLNTPEPNSTLGFLDIEPQTSSGITGAIIGTLGTGGTIVISVFIVIIIAGFIVVMIKRKS